MATTAATVAAETEGPAHRIAPEWVIFGSGDECFAVPLKQVREILLPQPITRLPGCGPEVCGLAGLRGVILTVFDMGAALGLRSAVSTPDHRLLMLEFGGHLVAGVVERVIAVTHLAVAADADAGLDAGWRIKFGEPTGASASASTAPRMEAAHARVARALDLDLILGRLLA